VITLTRLVAAKYKGLESLDLHFPERGSFLIEGRNEAGKSTLFDAIHFGLYGTPLVGDQADSINYGAETAEILLGIRVGSTRLEVRRSVRQTAKSIRTDAELEVTRGDDVEVVKGARPVMQRLRQELGGLTAEALLNSCLVAQKQLGRLETLARSDREAALTVLLNLDKLNDVYSRLRVKPEDEEQVRRARARVELARVSGELLMLGEARAALERTRQLIELREVLDQLSLNDAAWVETETEAAAQTARLTAVRQQLDTLHAIREKQARWERVSELAERAHGAETDLVQLRQQIDALATVEAGLPALRARLDTAQASRGHAQRLLDVQARAEVLAGQAASLTARRAERAELTARCERLDGDLTKLRKQHKDIQAQIAQLAQLTTKLEASRVRQTRLDQLRRQLATLQQRRAGLETLEQLAERAAGLLEKWLDARHKELEAQRARRLLDDLALGISEVEHVSLERSTTNEAGAGLRLHLLVAHPLTGGVALHLAVWPGGADLVGSRKATQKEVERLSGSGVPTLSAGDLTELERDRRTIEDALTAIDEVRPEDTEAAQRRITQPAAAEGVTRARQEIATLEARCLADAQSLHLDPALMTPAALADATASALQHEGARQAELSVSAGRREGLLRELSLLERNGKERRGELDECRVSLERDSDESLAAGEALLQSETKTATAGAVHLQHDITAYLTTNEAGNTPPLIPFGDWSHADTVQVRDALQRHVDGLAGDVASLERRVADRTALAERVVTLERAAEEWRRQLDETIAGLAAASAPEQDSGGPSSSVAGEDADNRPVLLVRAAERVAELRSQLAAQDEPALRTEEQAIQRAAGGAENTLAQLSRDADTLTSRALQVGAALGRTIEPTAAPAASEATAAAGLVEALHSAIPEVAGALPSRWDVERQLSTLDQQRGDLDRGARDARTALGAEDALPLDVAETALAALQEDLAARKRGQEIVGNTRQRMINKVLPGTVDNMCLLLPMLTAERYRFAELTADYRLQVWDERKRGFVEKSLFSGGTQDQFSLALRLGFALAALPRELGTSPGFLFLDEPLSSFDRDRTEALVGLLTTGQIATFFQQVFLISHSQSFDPGLFSHHIVMEHGEVSSSTLPTGPVPLTAANASASPAIPTGASA